MAVTTVTWTIPIPTAPRGDLKHCLQASAGKEPSARMGKHSTWGHSTPETGRQFQRNHSRQPLSRKADSGVTHSSSGNATRGNVGSGKADNGNAISGRADSAKAGSSSKGRCGSGHVGSGSADSRTADSGVAHSARGHSKSSGVSSKRTLGGDKQASPCDGEQTAPGDGDCFTNRLF
ncbi:UNVERIFIED_CONTAM: hypothetical protein FKN15_014680 [Acipenser sinensis]